MVRWISAPLGALAALSLSACGDRAADEEQNTAGAATENMAATENIEQEDGLSALDAVAERACGASDAAIMDALPDGASFSSRNAQGIVVIACTLDDVNGVYRIDSTALPSGVRADFDFEVAEHMRHGLRVGDDRSGTGAYRQRDGGFCAVQTDVEVSRRVCEAARETGAASDRDR